VPELTFYFDLGSPYAYLASERLETLIAGPVRWQPVLLGGLFKLTGRSSWALGDYQRRQRGMAEIERRGRGYALPPLRWPDPWPSDYLLAMRVATFAYRRGESLGREFTRQAYRAAFQRGVDLSIPAHVLAAAREAGLDAGEAGAAAADPEIKAALRAATEEAHARGVFGVPTLAVGDELFWGDDRLASAAAAATAAGGAGVAGGAGGAAAAAPDKIVR
jgi:2-hydroxychromene-2-carboxylate isomerase